MSTEYWLWAGWIIKVILYISVAMSIGGSFSYVLLSKHANFNKIVIHYILVGASLGIFASLASFFIQVGSFANNGLAGLFDLNFINLLLHTPVGTVQTTRIVCFIIIFLLIYILSRAKCWYAYLQWFAISIVSLVLVGSFSQLGHVTNLSAIAQILITIHVLAMSLWMGALFPLWKLSQSINGDPLKDTMHLFGRLAVFIVGLLVICGMTVAYLLLKDFNTLISTPYGQGFMIKLGLVGSILLLAAFNKWYFTPRLRQPQFAKQLGYAILFEMSLGLSILLVTGYITSVIGIE